MTTSKTLTLAFFSLSLLLSEISKKFSENFVLLMMRHKKDIVIEHLALKKEHKNGSDENESDTEI